MNFADIKTTLDINAQKAFFENNTKEVKKYLTLIKSPTIVEQYKAYSLVEQGKANSKESALHMVNKILKSLPVTSSNFSLDNIIESDNNLYKALDYIRKDINDISKYETQLDIVVNHLLREDVQGENLNVPDMALAIQLMVNKFNNKYGDLVESDTTFKNIITSIFEDYNKRDEVFNNMKKETLELVNEALNTDDIEYKIDLLNVKEKLLEMSFNNDTYINDIYKMKLVQEGF